MPSRTLLVAAGEFDDLSAERVAHAVAQGLRDGGWDADECAIDGDDDSADARALIRAAAFDGRLRASRAVVIAEPRLREQTLAGTIAFEIATRARQSGVPAYAVTGENLLDSFDARILDLQTILSANTHRSLRIAGLTLAELA
ncbi:MAG TPA: glycerate kinase [Solirubrobacteraceae bacterium]|nr:glycerate kinase [Solirubrobacteraceae bacterium]